MTSAAITVNPGTAAERIEEIQEGEVLEIGRKPPASSNRQLLFVNPEVSRLHAVIGWHSRGLALIDCSSVNGTQINGERLVAQRPYLLRVGDRVVIGGFDLVITSCPEPDEPIEDRLRRNRRKQKLEIEDAFEKLRTILPTLADSVQDDDVTER